MKLLKYISIVLCSVVMIGCSDMTPVSLQPVVHTQNINNVGKGKIIALRVIDARNNALVEKDAFPTVTRAMKDNSSNTVQAVYQEAVKGFAAAGFNVINGNAAHSMRAVTITINKIHVQAGSNVDVMGNSLLAVSAINNGRQYKNTYYAEESKYPIFGLNRKLLLDKAVSESLTKIFFDRELMQLLAR